MIAGISSLSLLANYCHVVRLVHLYESFMAEVTVFSDLKSSYTILLNPIMVRTAEEAVLEYRFVMCNLLAFSFCPLLSCTSGVIVRRSFPMIREEL